VKRLRTVRVANIHDGGARAYEELHDREVAVSHREVHRLRLHRVGARVDQMLGDLGRTCVNALLNAAGQKHHRALPHRLHHRLGCKTAFDRTQLSRAARRKQLVTWAGIS
jgi:hypothetical protein